MAWAAACATTVPLSFTQLMRYTVCEDTRSSEELATLREGSAGISVSVIPAGVVHGSPFLVMEQESMLVALQVMVELSPAWTRGGAAVIEADGTTTVTGV